MDFHIRGSQLLTILTALPISPVQTVSALSVHCELDKSYYHPVDIGDPLLLCNNDGPNDMAISSVRTDIVGIGTLESDLMNLTAVQNKYGDGIG